METNKRRCNEIKNILWTCQRSVCFYNLCVFTFCSSASSSFPYLKKRIQVVEQQSTEMNPIEVAIDEMSRKVSELNQLCNMEEVDMIRLQLKLQGSVSVKVGDCSDAHVCVIFASPDNLFPPPGQRRADGLCQGVFRGEECQEIPRQPGQAAEGDLQVGPDFQKVALILKVSPVTHVM